MLKRVSFKKDKFKEARGKFSRLLKIYCRKCGGLVVIYQKDGPGNLRRLYLDRIFFPKNLMGLERKRLETIAILKCKGCKEMLGVPYIYPKEKRKAFKLFQDVVVKKGKKAK